MRRKRGSEKFPFVQHLSVSSEIQNLYILIEQNLHYKILTFFYTLSYTKSIKRTGVSSETATESELKRSLREQLF